MIDERKPSDWAVATANALFASQPERAPTAESTALVEALFGPNRAAGLGDYAQQAGSSVVSGAAELVAGPVGFTGRMLGWEAAQRASASVRAGALAWAPPSTSLAAQDSFWANTVPAAVPSLLAALGGGWAVHAGKIGLGSMIAGEAAIFGPMTGEQVAMGVEQAGGSEGAQKLAALGGLAVGAMQTTAAGLVVRRLDAASGGIVSNALRRIMPGLDAPSVIGPAAGYTGTEMLAAGGRTAATAAAGAGLNGVFHVMTRAIHDWATDDEMSVLSGLPEAMGVGAIFGAFLNGVTEVALHHRTMTGRKQLDGQWHGPELGELEGGQLTGDESGDWTPPESVTPAEHFAVKVEAAVAEELHHRVYATMAPINDPLGSIVSHVQKTYNLPPSAAHVAAEAIYEVSSRTGVLMRAPADSLPPPGKSRPIGDAREGVFQGDGVEANRASAEAQRRADARESERLAGGYVRGQPRPAGTAPRSASEAELASEVSARDRLRGLGEPVSEFAENVAGRPGIAYSPGRTTLAGTNVQLGTRHDALGAPQPIVQHADAPFTVTDADTSGNPKHTPVGLQEVHDSIHAVGQFWGDMPTLLADTGPLFAAQYSETPEAVYVRSIGHVVEQAHETGHHIWKKVAEEDASFVKEATQSGAVHDELVALGKDLYRGREPLTGYAREGFSELFALWVSGSDRVHTAAPNSARWLEANVLMPRPELANRARQAQKTFEQHRWQGSEKTVQAIIGRAPRALDIIPTDKAEAVELARLLAVQLVSSGSGLTRLAKKIKQGGVKLTGMHDVDSLWKALIGHATTVMETAVSKETRDFSGRRTGDCLDVAVSPWQGLDKDTVINPYLISQRAVSRPDINYGITIETARDNIARLEAKHGARLARGAAGYHAWRERMLDYVAAADPILAERIKAMREAEPHYTPAMRIFDELLAEPFKGTSSGPRTSATQGNLSQAIVGSYRKIIDPFGETLRVYNSYIAAAHQRYVVNALVEAAPHPGVGSMVVVSELGPVRIEDAGMTMFQLPDPKVRSGAFSFQMDQVVPGQFRADGRPVVRKLQVSVPYDVNAALVAMRPQDVVAGLGVMGRSFHWLMARQKEIQVLTMTGARPAFVFFTNVVRDMSYSVLFGKGKNPLRILAEHTYIMGRVLGDEASRLAGGHLPRMTYDWRGVYERAGIGMNNFATTHAGVSKTADQLLRTKGQRVVRALHSPLETLRMAAEYMGGISESPARIRAIQQKAKELGWDPSMELTPDHLVAFRVAGTGEGAVRFAESGDWSRKMNTVTPFFTAAIGGPREALRAVKANPLEFSIKAAVVTAAGAAMWAVNKFGKENQEDKWYDRSTSRDRFGSIRVAADVLRADGLHKTTHRIPISPEFAVFYHMAEMAIDAAYEQDPRSAIEYLQMLAHQLPLPMPATLGTAIEFASNERNWPSAFGIERSSPIVPPSAADMPVTEQVGPYTTWVSRNAGEALGVSPMKLDYLIRELGGGLGGDMASAVDQLLGTRLGKGQAGVAEWFMFLDRGSRIKMNSRPVSDLMEGWEVIDRSSKSLKHPLEPREAAIHGIYSDAVKAVWALSAIGQMSESIEQREKLFRLANDVAQDFLGQMNGGSFDPSRFEAMRRVTGKASTAMKALGAQR